MPRHTDMGCGPDPCSGTAKFEGRRWDRQTTSGAHPHGPAWVRTVPLPGHTSLQRPKGEGTSWRSDVPSAGGPRRQCTGVCHCCPPHPRCCPGPNQRMQCTRCSSPSASTQRAGLQQGINVLALQGPVGADGATEGCGITNPWCFSSTSVGQLGTYVGRCLQTRTEPFEALNSPGRPPPATGYRCVCTTGAVRRKCKAKVKEIFSDISQAPFAAADAHTGSA